MQLKHGTIILILSVYFSKANSFSQAKVVWPGGDFIIFLVSQNIYQYSNFIGVSDKKLKKKKKEPGDFSVSCLSGHAWWKWEAPFSITNKKMSHQGHFFRISLSSEWFTQPPVPQLPKIGTFSLLVLLEILTVSFKVLFADFLRVPWKLYVDGFLETRINTPMILEW